MYREITEKESLRLLKSVLSDDHLTKANFKNHRRHEENVYKITVNMLSLASLLKLLEDAKVETVYWHPSASPPNTHVSSVASRHMLYIKYNKIKKRTRRISK